MYGDLSGVWQDQEANQGVLIDLLSNVTDNNNSIFPREIELSSSPYIEESISLLGNLYEH